MELPVNIDEIKENGLDLRRDLPAAELDAVLRAPPATGPPPGSPPTARPSSSASSCG
jgi:hypothetical protein